VERTPPFLAALAGSAVPGLDPLSVEALPSTPEQSFDVAFVEDTQHRRWVVRAPRSATAAARMDLTVTLLGMLARRLPFAVPSPKGFVELKEGGRATVYPFLPGRQLDFGELPPGPGITAELGRAIAALHNVDVALFDEAGMPTYDADDYRTRRLAELDRAAESGKVPAALLTRWEKALEDVTLWRFAPTPVHGDLTGDQVLAVFENDEDSSTGRIRAMTGWEDAKVADPADDFAALVSEAGTDAVETVLEAYAHARVERPDRHLLIRARLAAELGILSRLMVALSEGHSGTVETLTAELRRLDSTVHPEPSESDDYRRTSLDPPVIRPRQTPPPIVEDEPEEELPQVATEPDEDAPGPDEDHDNRTPAEDTTAPQETPDDAPGPDEDHDNRTPAEEEPTAGATAADPEEPTARELPPELQ
jgi:aminoglycoside phosphotransferase (APT) family kinase protein